MSCKNVKIFLLAFVTVTQSPRLADEALAGLASTENFSKVALCKVDSINRQGNFQPFADKMLLHVKGSDSYNNNNNNNNIHLISQDKPLDHNTEYIYTSVTQNSYLGLDCHAGQPMVLDH